MIVVQTFNRDGWPSNSTIELEDGTAAAILTAARDFQAEDHVDLKGDLVAVPAGGLRPEPWIVEMQWAFDHRHDTGANKARSLALYTHYNMDAASNARPVLSSPHAHGFCADIADHRFLAWLKSPDPHRPGHNIAARYGLVFTLLKENDLRHAQFFPGTVTAALDVTSLDNTASSIQEDDMFLLYNPSSQHPDRRGLHIPGRPLNIITTAQAVTLTGLLKKYRGLPDDAADSAVTDNVTDTEWALIVLMEGQVTLGQAPATGGSGAPFNPQPILDAIAALGKQESAEQAALLTAISQVDENTLATFGLKRA